MKIWKVEDGMVSKYYKETFLRVTKERKERVFKAAKAEFATKGYMASNINTIAKEAGISIGSLYSYFASKEDLFLCLLEQGCDYLHEALSEVDLEQNIIEVLRALFNKAFEYAHSHPEINQMYLDVTSQGMSYLANRLSHKIEAETAALYKKAIQLAKARGEISKELDEQVLSFCFDNLILMYQFAFTSDYYYRRMNIFIEANELDSKKSSDMIVESMLLLISSMLKG